MHILKKILEKVRRRRKFVNNIIHHDPKRAPQAKIFLDFNGKYADQRIFHRCNWSPSKKCAVPPKGQNPSCYSIFENSQLDRKSQKSVPTPTNLRGGGANYESRPLILYSNLYYRLANPSASISLKKGSSWGAIFYRVNYTGTPINAISV